MVPPLTHNQAPAAATSITIHHPHRHRGCRQPIRNLRQTGNEYAWELSIFLRGRKKWNGRFHRRTLSMHCIVFMFGGRNVSGVYQNMYVNVVLYLTHTHISKQIVPLSFCWSKMVWFRSFSQTFIRSPYRPGPGWHYNMLGIRVYILNVFSISASRTHRAIVQNG